jgi:hypothetical protein
MSHILRIDGFCIDIFDTDFFPVRLLPAGNARSENIRPRTR